MGTYFTTTTKTSSTSHSLNNRRQNAEGSRSHQAHEAQHRAGRHRREEGGVPRRVHQAAVGLHQEAQPAGPREQAVLHPRQEDGKGVRRRPHPRLRHGQVPLCPPLLIYFPFLLPKKPNETNFTRPDFSFPCVQNDIQHSGLIRPTIDSPLPSSNSPSLLEMPSPRTAELTTEPFSRLRDEPQSRLAFSRGGDWRSPTSSKCRPHSKYYQD